MKRLTSSKGNNIRIRQMSLTMDDGNIIKSSSDSPTMRITWLGHATFLIENVPLVTCPSCGESYLTAETLKEIERIRMHWRQLTVEKKIPLAKFGGAA